MLAVFIRFLKRSHVHVGTAVLLRLVDRNYHRRHQVTPGRMFASNSLRKSAVFAASPPPSSPIHTLKALLQRMKTPPRCWSEEMDASAGIGIGVALIGSD